MVEMSAGGSMATHYKYFHVYRIRTLKAALNRVLITFCHLKLIMFVFFNFPQLTGELCLSSLLFQLNDLFCCGKY